MISNMYLIEVFLVSLAIKDMCASKDPYLVYIRKISLKMKDKYDKYWRSLEILNMLISFVLDHRKGA